MGKINKILKPSFDFVRTVYPGPAYGCSLSQLFLVSQSVVYYWPREKKSHFYVLIFNIYIRNSFSNTFYTFFNMK